MPDTSEKRIRKSFPGVKERREGERGRRLLSTSSSGDSITQRKVVDISCRKGNVWKKSRVGEEVSLRREYVQLAGVGVHMYIYTKCMCIFIYTAEKVHVHTKVYQNPHCVNKNLSCASPQKIIKLT